MITTAKLKVSCLREISARIVAASFRTVQAVRKRREQDPQFAAQRQLQRNEKNRERTEEGRPLNKGKEHVELQILEEL